MRCRVHPPSWESRARWCRESGRGGDDKAGQTLRIRPPESVQPRRHPEGYHRCEKVWASIRSSLRYYCLRGRV